MGTCNILEHRNIESYFHKILEVLSDGIVVSDKSGKILMVNKVYENLTGLKRAEIIGKLATELKKQGKFDVILNPSIVKTGKSKTGVQTTQTGRKIILIGHPVHNEKGNVDLVVTFVRDVTLLSELKQQITSQQKKIGDLFHKIRNFNDNVSPLIIKSENMLALLKLADSIAAADAPVLILGETGVGKDLIARRIYEKSPRHRAPFIKIDCTTIPANLLESELFGYVSGAFSGASSKGKAGLIEIADNGTLFLDEIGELPYSMQGKLLRLLQDNEIMRLGSTQLKKIDVRFIIATNRDLEEEVRLGNFRSDLFYRLKVAVLNIPPLRERRKDILCLVEHYLKRYNIKYKKNLLFSPEAEEKLLTYNWPGNVRELNHLIQSIVISSHKNIIEPTDLPHNVIINKQNNFSNSKCIEVDIEKGSLAEIMDRFEEKLLRDAIIVHGSINKVAKELKVNRATIYRRVKKYSLPH